MRAPRSTLAAVCSVLSAGALLTGAAGASAGPSHTRDFISDGNENLVVPPPDALVTDATVQYIRTLGKRAYLGGGMSRAGRYTGPMLRLDPASGALDAPSARLNGQVSDVVPDGGGGFFAAGRFTLAGDAPHGNVVHVLPNGFVDPAFLATTDDLVTSLVLVGDRLFVGGDFTRAGGAEHHGLAELDARTGAPTLFAASFADRVTELAYRPAADGRPARLFVGTPEGLTAVNAADGTPAAGFSASPSVRGPVRALALDGDTLYVGQADVVALDAATGVQKPGFTAALPAPAAPTNLVHILLVDKARLLVGGSFARGSALVALDPRTGAKVASFAADVTARPTDTLLAPDSDNDTGVFDLVRVGEELWVGGQVERAGGAPVENLAIVDATTGARVPRTLPFLGGQVNALAAGGGRLFVGGNFVMAGAQRVGSGLLAADARTLVVDPRFRPTGVQAYLGGNLVAGAEHLFLPPQSVFDDWSDAHVVPRFDATRDTVATLDAATGAFSRHGIGTIRNLTGFVVDGDTVLLARRLENRPGFPRTVIERRRGRDGKVLKRFRVPLRGYIQSLTLDRGSLYVAGSFRRKRPNGQQANLAVLRLDPETGRMYQGFDPHTHGPVAFIKANSDGLGLFGTFDKIAGRRQRDTATVERLFGSYRDLIPDPPGTSSFPVPDQRTLAGQLEAGYNGFAEDVPGGRLVAGELAGMRVGGSEFGYLNVVLFDPGP